MLPCNSEHWELEKYFWEALDGKLRTTYLLVRTSIWFKSLFMLSPSFSICFLGRSDKRRILCFLHFVNQKTMHKWYDICFFICCSFVQQDVWSLQLKLHQKFNAKHYLAVAVPRRMADSWNLFSCFSMKNRWLLTPQIIIWSLSITCSCAPSLILCMWFCKHDTCLGASIKIITFNLIKWETEILTLNCSVIVLNKRE